MKIFGPDERKPTFAELLADCTASAVHLEIHDAHQTTDPGFLAFQAGQDFVNRDQARAWVDVVSSAVARGVAVRRARIISEPVSDYTRYMHAVAPAFQLAAGEQLRWLPRHVASALPVPSAPFWVFDDRLVRFSVYDGFGDVIGHQFSEDPAVVEVCARAFNAVWNLALPHDEYRL
ncbi:DUF6879 family protein [Nonomuraea sp. NPDC052265]|uniref:DUF6879 family protein n=1 Tax=Nonomuraea sp. NPDC052265 TaxID=3364374 RepID=UPI0037C52069